MPFLAVPGAFPLALSRPRGLRSRTALTEQAGGKAHSYGRKGRRKSESLSFLAACCAGRIYDDLPLTRERPEHSRRTKSELSRPRKYVKYVSSGFGRWQAMKSLRLSRCSPR